MERQPLPEKRAIESFFPNGMHCIRLASDIAFLRYAYHVTKPELQSHWHMEIPQRIPKDSAQVHPILFLLEGGVWG